MLVIHWLGEVTNDAVLQRAVPDGLIRVCGNEDRRNSVPRISEVFVELNSSHSRHLDIGDQAGSFRKERRCEEIGCRRERFDSVTQQPYEFFHGFSKELIILDDRYQWMLRHRDFSAPAIPASPVRRACMQLGNVGGPSRQSNAGDRKRWFRRSAIRLDLGTVDVRELCIECAQFWREEDASFKAGTEDA
jgi:hypothetical protein